MSAQRPIISGLPGHPANLLFCDFFASVHRTSITARFCLAVKTATNSRDGRARLPAPALHPVVGLRVLRIDWMQHTHRGEPRRTLDINGVMQT